MLELGVVALGQAENAGDDLYGEVEGEVADQVGPPDVDELVDEVVGDGGDEVALPTSEHLLAEGKGDEGPVRPVLMSVHLEDGAPHDWADDVGDDRGREGRGVTEHVRDGV